MKKLFLSILVICSLLGGNAYSANLNLTCEGIGSKSKTMSQSGSTSELRYFEETNSIVNVSIGNKGNWIQMPMHLLPRKRIKKANNKYEIYDLKISEGSISGKFKLNFVNKPSMTIDRYSGVLSFVSRGKGISFTGECKKVDREEKKF
jgi:hypothetical protein